jgi:large subunit ribosomal protein L30
MAKQDIKEIKITQIKSVIGFSIDQKKTMQALGIRKMHQTRTHKATPQILGMVNKIKHLLKVEEV